jgi:hypothetical protein
MRRTSEALKLSMVWMPSNEDFQSCQPFPVALENIVGQAPGAMFVLPFRLITLCPRQGLQQAMTHLGGGFAGEGNGENFVRTTDSSEQRQKTLGQKFGLARTGRSLDDERTFRVQGERGRRHR